MQITRRGGNSRAHPRDTPLHLGLFTASMFHPYRRSQKSYYQDHAWSTSMIKTWRSPQPDASTSPAACRSHAPYELQLTHSNCPAPNHKRMVWIGCQFLKTQSKSRNKMTDIIPVQVRLHNFLFTIKHFYSWKNVFPFTFYNMVYEFLLFIQLFICMTKHCVCVHIYAF